MTATSEGHATHPGPEPSAPYVRLLSALIGNALMRIASSAGGVLVAIYLADLSGHGWQIGPAMVGILGAVILRRRIGYRPTSGNSL
jgi:hypothetical protein